MELGKGAGEGAERAARSPAGAPPPAPCAPGFRAASALSRLVAEGGRWPLLDSVSAARVFYSPRCALRLSSTSLVL